MKTYLHFIDGRHVEPVGQSAAKARAACWAAARHRNCPVASSSSPPLSCAPGAPANPFIMR